MFLLKHLYLIHLDKVHGIETSKSPTRSSNEDDPVLKKSPKNHCNLCNKTFSKTKSYQQHLFNFHSLMIPALPSKRIITSDIEPVVDLVSLRCNVCDRKYTMSYGYRYHMSKYHNIKSFSVGGLSCYVNRSKVPVIDEVGSHCTACDKVLKNRASYKAHLFSIHGIALPKKAYKRRAIKIKP
ncbi:hypothetical protein EDC94DRAFT_658828 [Helicostylum pulchrum]|nr:hypothetical protein EDC94DRAFT_658828 [Helicostylum pulchrum]